MNYAQEGKNIGFSWKSWDLFLKLYSFVTLGKSFKYSETEFFYTFTQMTSFNLQKKDNSLQFHSYED